jgi:methionyl aminopeptidase
MILFSKTTFNYQSLILLIFILPFNLNSQDNLKNPSVLSKYKWRAIGPANMGGRVTDIDGIPGDKTLKEGDIINVDVTAYKDGWHGDTSRMFYVGDVSVKAKKLTEVTYNSMMKAIKILSKDITLGDIGSTIQTYVEGEGFSVVRDFCGHGIGKVFHKEPNILHYGKKGAGPKLKSGMIFTIEPMINEGSYQTKMLNDGWTAVSKDKKLSAQFEHTIGITDTGYEVFTLSKNGMDYPPYTI